MASQTETTTAKRAGIFEHLDTVIVRVRHLDKARAWYEEKLELKPAFVHSDIVVFDTGGATSLTIWRMGEGEKLAPRHFQGCFSIFYPADLDAAYALLKDRGVEVGPFDSDGDTRWFSFHDPEGNRLGCACTRGMAANVSFRAQRGICL